jgi:hypothetical protein
MLPDVASRVQIVLTMKFCVLFLDLLEGRKSGCMFKPICDVESTSTILTLTKEQSARIRTEDVEVERNQTSAKDNSCTSFQAVSPVDIISVFILKHHNPHNLDIKTHHRPS